MPREYIFSNATQSRAQFYHTYLVMSCEWQRHLKKKWAIPMRCGNWCSVATGTIRV